MSASRAARERKATAQAGELAIVKIDPFVAGEEFVYRISCRQCSTVTEKGTKAWWTFRPGRDNGFMAAMDRWIFHLVENHAGTQAPCLAYRGEAEERLQQRRDQLS